MRYIDVPSSVIYYLLLSACVISGSAMCTQVLSRAPSSLSLSSPSVECPRIPGGITLLLLKNGKNYAIVVIRAILRRKASQIAGISLDNDVYIISAYVKMIR